MNNKQQGTQTARTYVNNPAVAAAVAMNQQQQAGGPAGQRGSRSGSGTGPSGSGNTTIIRPAPGTTTDVIIRRPGPDGQPPPLPRVGNQTQRITTTPGGTQVVRVPGRNQQGPGPVSSGSNMTGSVYGSLNSSTLLPCPNPACGNGIQCPYHNAGQACPYPGCNNGAVCPYHNNPAQQMTWLSPPTLYGIGAIPTLGPTQYAGPQYPINYFQGSPTAVAAFPQQRVGAQGSQAYGPQFQPTRARRNQPPNTMLDFGDDVTVPVNMDQTSGSMAQPVVPFTRRLTDQEYIKLVLQGIQQAMDPAVPVTSPLDFDNVRNPQGPPGLSVLFDTENFFIEPADGSFAEVFYDMRCKFDILDTNGDRLFYAADSLNSFGPPERSGCCASDPFRLSVIGCDGTEYLSVAGDSGAVGIRITIPDSTDSGSKFLGYIVPDSNCCSINTDYVIKDRGGHVCFKVLHEDPNPNPTEFEIYGNDMMKIGRMSKVWAGLPVSDQQLAHTYGVSFPRDMDVREKALMLAGLFAIYFKYFADRNRDRRIARNAWITVIMVLIFFIAFVVGLVFLAVHILRST